MMTPSINYIKAQIRNLNINKQEELLHFLTEEVERIKIDGEVPKKTSINDFLTYVPNFIDDDILREGLVADALKLGIKGRKINKVYTKWIGNMDYSYGQIRHPKSPLDDSLPFIKELMAKVNNDSRCGAPRSCFVAYLPSGQAYINPHADDEDILDHDNPICVISIGANRLIDFLDGDGHEVLKSVLAEDCSMYIMKAGCQQLFRHAVPPSNDSNCGERFVFSFRTTIPSECANGDMLATNLSSSSETVQEYRDNEISFGPLNPVQPRKKVSLILGASIIKGLIPSKLGKGDNECYVRARGGIRLPKIMKELDDFYSEHGEKDVGKVFVSAGINDIRYCRDGIRHLRSQIIQLIERIRTYFPGAKIYFQSVLPVFIENNYIVRNTLSFNKMLYEICLDKRCFYLDIIRRFLSPIGDVRNECLYSDRVHLNKYGLAVLARVYILHINRDRFNPVLK